MSLVVGKEDIVIIAGDHCRKCADAKLGVLKQWEVSEEEVRDLIKDNVRVVRVRDECSPTRLDDV